MILLETCLFVDGGNQTGAQILFGMRDDHDPRSRRMFEDVM